MAGVFRNILLKRLFGSGLLFLSIVTMSVAQSFSFDDYFVNFSKGIRSPVTISQLKNWQQVTNNVNKLYPYIYHGDEHIRLESLRIIGLLAKDHPAIQFRQEAVRTLLQLAQEKNSSISSLIVSTLKSFSPADFDDRAKRSLEKLLFNGSPHLQDFILLAGYLQMERALNTAYHLYESKKNLRGAVNLALARCGDQAKVQAIVDNIKDKPLNDDLIYGDVQWLIYIRQKIAFDYLFEIIVDDQKKCTPADAEISGSILCGYRVMEYIAPLIQNSPIPIDPTTNTLLTDSYPEALQLLRAWIENNKDHYQLVNSIY